MSTNCTYDSEVQLSMANYTDTSNTSLDLEASWMNFDAASISLGEHVKTNDHQHDFLVSLMGDITPATSTMTTESPMMDTPFLDGSIGTPYTPASVFTPCLDMFNTNNMDTSSSPYTNQSLHMSLDDVHVGSYLLDSKTNSVAPFNGSPAELLLNNNNYDASDALFPPLPSNEDQDVPSTALMGDDALDFGADSFEFLGLGFDMFMMPESQANEPAEQNKSTLPVKAGKITKRKRESKVVQLVEDRRFECPLCNTKFTRRFNLGTHIKTHDKARQKDHVCYICDKGFDRKHDCDRHISTVHHGERSYGCDDCSSHFSRRDALTRHQIQKHGYEDIA